MAFSRVGILTFHWADNYGALLQARSLMDTVAELGHRPEFINYVPAAQRMHPLRLLIARSPRQLLTKWSSAIQAGRLSSFRRTLPATPLYTSYHALSQNPPAADAYICGSDQIWNNTLLGDGDLRPYLLDFGGPAVRRVAYAPSLGNGARTPEVLQIFDRQLPRFSAVSVRETSALQFVREHGASAAELMPDPTLLRPRAERLAGGPSRAAGKDTALMLYLIEPSVPQTDAVLRVLAEKGMTGGTNLFMGTRLRAPGIRNIIVSPADWMAHLRQAQLVVTNSYHGTIFSILYNRPFVCLAHHGVNGPKNDRITTLLEPLGLASRIVWGRERDEISAALAARIDWAKVNAGVSAHRQRGLEFLRRAL